MPAKAGEIVINIKAGTAKFVQDMEVVKGKVREVGESGVSESKAMRAAFKALEGQTFNNTKAAEVFAEKLLGAGNIAKFAFPVIGVAAFIGFVVEAGNKVREFFKNMAEGPDKIANAFRSLNAPLQTTNDELQVANDRLENDIAKLEGKRQNNLKIALDEARVAADKLADSLDRGLASLNKLVKENDVSLLQQFFHTAGTGDIKKEFGGDTGTEGFLGRINDITDIGNGHIRAATDAKARDAAQTQLNTILLNEYAAEIEKVNRMLVESREVQREHEAGFAPDDQGARIAVLTGALRQLQAQRDGISLQSANNKLTDRKNALTTADANSNLGKPLEDRLKTLGVQLDGVRAKLAAIGQPEAAQILARSYGEAQKAIEEVNKALDKTHGKLTESQEAQIRQADQDIASAEAEVTWRTKLESTTTSIGDRIAAQQRLTAAIGQGYEATKTANVETQLAATLGEHFNDPAWMKSHSGDVDRLRSGFGGQFDAEHAEKTATAVDGLNRQIDLERQLAQVQEQGAQAVRDITLMAKLRQMVTEGATRQQIQAEVDLYDAERANASSAAVAGINQKIAATERMTAAIFCGAEAQRQAALEAKYAEMQHNGDSPAQIAAERALDQAEHQKQITEEAGRTVTAFGDQIEKLDQIEGVLQKQIKDNGDSLELEIALRDIENQRLRLAVEQELKLKGAKDGMKAFFLEMQEDAKSAADIVYEALNSSLDKVSEQFSKLFTGQKTSFGKTFESVGQDMVKQSTKSMMQLGLGQLGKVLGIHAPAGKPDGSQGNPFHVIVKGGGGAGGAGDPGTGGAAGSAAGSAMGGVFQAALGKIGGFFSKLWGGLTGSGAASDVTFLAGGGNADPGKIYGIAEAGEGEFVTPRNASTVTPLSKMGFGGQHVYNIDARGADLGADNRVRRAIEFAHNSAVTNAQRATAERAKRTPKRTS